MDGTGYKLCGDFVRSEQCLRGLLALEPECRWSVAEALQSELFCAMRCGDDASRELRAIRTAAYQQHSVQRMNDHVVVSYPHFLDDELKTKGHWQE